MSPMLADILFLVTQPYILRKQVGHFLKQAHELPCMLDNQEEWFQNTTSTCRLSVCG